MTLRAMVGVLMPLGRFFSNHERLRASKPQQEQCGNLSPSRTHKCKEKFLRRRIPRYSSKRDVGDDSSKKGDERNDSAILYSQEALEKIKFIEAEIAEAVSDAGEVCEAESANDCASAWDKVEELSAARSHILARERYLRGESSHDRGTVHESTTNPASLNEDLTKLKNPCDVEECSPPTGSLEAAGRLESIFGQNIASDFEKLMEKDEKDVSASEEQDKKLDNLESVLEAAQQTAQDICSEGSTDECSAAWDIYDEILNESSKQKKLRDSGEL